MKMTMKKIVEQYLKKHGYDGLCTNNCGCFIGDLIPCECDCPYTDCVPGYKIKCKDKESDCYGEIIISEKKEGK